MRVDVVCRRLRKLGDRGQMQRSCCRAHSQRILVRRGRRGAARLRTGQRHRSAIRHGARLAAVVGCHGSRRRDTRNCWPGKHHDCQDEHSTFAHRCHLRNYIIGSVVQASYGRTPQCDGSHTVVISFFILRARAGTDPCRRDASPAASNARAATAEMTLPHTQSRVEAKLTRT